METVYINGTIETEALTNNEDCVMALGFFDGVHLGHRKLIETSKEIAEQKNLTLTVMTFFPHPSNVLPTNRKITRYLSPLDAKKEIFKELGVEKLYIVTFNDEFAKLSPADFVQKYICGLNCRHVVAGFDFTYGYKGKGNMDRIREDGGGQFDISVVAKKSYKNNKISSTKIRELLKAGKANDIPHYLGEHYSTYGKVENESNDFVTVSFKDYMLPRKGTYLVKVETDRNTYDGIVTLSENISGSHLIYVFSNQGLDLKSTVKVKWITELETLSQTEAIELTKRSNKVV